MLNTHILHMLFAKSIVAVLRISYGSFVNGINIALTFLIGRRTSIAHTARYVCDPLITGADTFNFSYPATLW